VEGEAKGDGEPEAGGRAGGAGVETGQPEASAKKAAFFPRPREGAPRFVKIVPGVRFFFPDGLGIPGRAFAT